MFKRFWLIWSRTVDHRIGRTDDEKPNIPILKNKDANIAKIALVITFLIILYLPFVCRVYKPLLLFSIFAVGYRLCIFLLLFHRHGILYFVIPFCFS